jgi:acetyl esterase/lipase
MVFLITFTTNWAGQVAVVPKSNEIEMTQEEKSTSMNALATNGHLTTHNFVRDIVNHPAFRQFGDLMLPSNDNTGYYDTPLSDVGSLMPYHSHVNPGIVVDALNRLIDEVNAGKTIFYEFYTGLQKRENQSKKFTGLFFFRGKPGAPFAIISPGGGFSYVASLHEGFPIALEISKKGFNAFVIRYRVDEQKATEDLAAAVAYVFSNAKALGVDTIGYSLWGASAGARMVGNIALNGVNQYARGKIAKPAAMVIAYTGQSSYSDRFPPTFITISANDRIANIETVEKRVANLRNAGVEIDYRRYENAGHGFGLGIGSDAEGWIEHAIQFWKNHLSK